MEITHAMECYAILYFVIHCVVPFGLFCLIGAMFGLVMDKTLSCEDKDDEDGGEKC